MPSAQPKLSFSDQLQAEIKTLGKISVEDFMTKVQWHYYTHQQAVGAEGDFITAPEITQVFGELIGVWLHQQWTSIPIFQHVHIIELGPGRGTLMKDVLRVLKNQTHMWPHLSFHMVEVNPILKKMQQENLKDYNIKWHEQLPDVNGESFIIISNEFFDALPLRQFIYTKDGWRERAIMIDDGRFVFTHLDDDVYIKLPSANAGDIYEHPSGAMQMIDAIGAMMKDEVPSLCLMIDYGPHLKKFGDTLQAVRRHEKINIFDHVGEADLTAHVNFPVLLDYLLEKNMRVFGPTTQRHFLTQLGINVRRQVLATSNPDQAESINNAIMRLIDPRMMGVLFKAMTFGNRCDVTLDFIEQKQKKKK